MKLPARTGPIGRSARLGWAVVVLVTLASIVDARGSARFRNPHILSEPSAWLLHVVALTMFVLLVGALAGALGRQPIVRRTQGLAVSCLGALVLVAAVIGQLGEGSVWGFPLADLVWTFDVLVLVEQLLAFVIAFALGTPGCELGVWPELIARARGVPAARMIGLACVVGLDALDRWEATRSARPR